MKLIDSECHKMALYFLADEAPTEARADELAQWIQEAVEDWMGANPAPLEDGPHDERAQTLHDLHRHEDPA